MTLCDVKILKKITNFYFLYKTNHDKFNFSIKIKIKPFESKVKITHPPPQKSIYKGIICGA